MNVNIRGNIHTKFVAKIVESVFNSTGLSLLLVSTWIHSFLRPPPPPPPPPVKLGSLYYVFYIFFFTCIHCNFIYIWNIRILHSFLPPKIRGEGGGVLVFEIWTKRGFMKKLLRNRGVSWEAGCLRKLGCSKLLHQFSLRKECFHYYWIFFVW